MLNFPGSNALTRRAFLRKGLSTAAALQLGTNALSQAPDRPAAYCKLVSEQEIGPYYLDHEILRHDVTEGKPGVPLILRITVMHLRQCIPIQNAALDIWQCDAHGVYSGYTAIQPGPPGMPPDGGDMPPPPPSDQAGDGPTGGPPMGKPTDKQTFLRGIQITDGHGMVEFRTIFPGCYLGRTNHIHMKVHIGGHVNGQYYAGGHVAHTGQVFFPEDISRAVIARMPYAEHKIHRTTLDEDHVFNNQGGFEFIAALSPIGNNAVENGYVATLIVGVNPDATPDPVSPRGPGGHRRQPQGPPQSAGL
jgi:protocatechuate 3,4-dioxygenase beta subunit